MIRVVGWLTGLATLVASAGYLVVSLNRWEWNRALFFGLLFLITEVALATGLVLRKLSALEQRFDPTVARILEDTRPPAPKRFRWLEESTRQTNVFITFLVGGGVILSGIAWLVDRIAARTTTPSGEARLAAQLTPIAYPPSGLLVDDVVVLAQHVPGADDAQLGKLLRPGRR